MKFILKIANKKEEAKNIVQNVVEVSYQYLGGRLLVMAIIAVVASVGLLLIDIRQAIFLGILAAILNLIPYLGPVLSAALPLAISIITKQSLTPTLMVLGLFVIIQVLENYILTPKIVGSKVRLNPLFTLFVILAGAYIWGVIGMILFIPFLGMLKVLFDHVDSLHAYGYLIGDPNHRTKKQ